MSKSEFRPLQVELPFVVKTYDVDYARIMHNSVYIRWLEDLRLQIMAEHLPLEYQLAGHQSPVLEKTEITYRSPLRLFDRAIGRMWVSKLSRVRWELRAEICQGEVVAATARQIGCFVDLEEYRPIRIPARLREKWESALAANDGSDL
jgi:acyl-CoA thioester hydrolase